MGVDCSRAHGTVENILADVYNVCGIYQGDKSNREYFKFLGEKNFLKVRKGSEKSQKCHDWLSELLHDTM